MPRRHGYAPVGQRCYGTCDWHAKGRTNVIGALVDSWLIAVGLFESSINADVFLAWIRHVLLPQLPTAAVIVLDNATFHKRADVQNTLRQAGHTLEYRPLFPRPQSHRAQMGSGQGHPQTNSLFRR